MSMEISGLNTQSSISDYSNLKKVGQEQTGNDENLNKIDNSQFDLPKDRYISHEDDETATKGIYKMTADENGSPNIIFEAPKAVKSENGVQNREKGDVPQKNGGKEKTEQWRGSTDKVDSEIKRLKNKKQQLEKQISGASAEDTDKLRQELEKINSELMQKDNDSYRRQHTTLTKV